jgi:hypothetical protein
MCMKLQLASYVKYLISIYLIAIWTKEGLCFLLYYAIHLHLLQPFAPFALSKPSKVVAFVAIDKKRDLCGDIRNDSENLLEYPYKA